MKRVISILFLSLYFYNIVGYIALFSFLQYRIRTEVKLLVKGSVPESEMVTLSFYTPSLDEYPIQWLDPHEFRFEGSLYDIVRSYTRSDTTYFVCLNDTQEEHLFEHLDRHVQRQMGDSGVPEKLDAFKDVLMHSFLGRAPTAAELQVWSFTPLRYADGYSHFEPDPPCLPPRLSSIVNV